MRNALFVAIVMLVVSGCASLPQESVTLQEKIGSGIETARRNQILLIEKLVEQEKQSFNLKAKSVAHDSLKKNAEKMYSTAEVESLLFNYSTHIESELKKIDDKHILLLQETNQLFDDLASMNSLNLELIKSVVELNKVYKSGFDQVKEITGSKFSEIIHK